MSHPGCYTIQELITHNYWWPGIQQDIRKHIIGCPKCQVIKSHRNTLHNPLQPNKIAKEPWDIISVNLIGKLPESNGYNAILVAIDCFTEQIHVMATKTAVTSEGMAKLYRDHIYKGPGIPRKFIHDRGTQLECKFINEFHRLLGIEGNTLMTYHPQTDGQIE